MSAEGAQAFYERVTSDKQFRAQVDAQETWEGKQRVATEAGYDVSRDDMPGIRKLAGRRELSDEDLDRAPVSGGDSGTFWNQGDMDDPDPNAQYSSTSNA
jgi:predicted ribosomally synthesized peptide with nif11-like leader